MPNHLKRIREKCSLTQKQVAEATGLTVNTISAIENGHTNMSSSTIMKLVKCYNVSTDEILGIPVKK